LQFNFKISSSRLREEPKSLMLELNDLRPRRGGKVDNYIDAVEDFENEKAQKLNAFEKQKRTHMIFIILALVVGIWMLFWILSNYDVTSAIMKKPAHQRSQLEIEQQEKEEFQIGIFICYLFEILLVDVLNF